MTLSNRSSSNSSFFSRNFLCPTVYWVISKGGLAYDYVGSSTSRGSPNNTFDFLILSSCSHLSSICYDIIPPLFTAIQFIRSLLTYYPRQNMIEFLFFHFFHCSLFNSKKAPFYNYILLSIIPFFRLDRFTAILLASHKNSRVTIVLLQLLWLSRCSGMMNYLFLSHILPLFYLSLFPSYHS